MKSIVESAVWATIVMWALYFAPVAFDGADPDTVIAVIGVCCVCFIVATLVHDVTLPIAHVAAGTAAAAAVLVVATANDFMVVIVAIVSTVFVVGTGYDAAIEKEVGLWKVMLVHLF